MSGAMKHPMVALALVAAAIAAGCSHGESDNQGGGTTGNLLSAPTANETRTTTGKLLVGVTKEEFAEAADAICTRYLNEQAQLPATPIQATRADVVSGEREYADLLRRQRAELKALRPPVSEARRITAWLATQHRREGLYAHFDPDQSAVTGPIARVEAQLKRQSTVLGMRKCFIVRYQPEPPGGPAPRPTGMTSTSSS